VLALHYIESRCEDYNCEGSAICSLSEPARCLIVSFPRFATGVLDVDEVEEISDSKDFRASALVSQSVLSSIESLRTEASASSVAGPSAASVDEEVESEGGKKKRNGLEGGVTASG
jgi:hypothetical protein